MQQQLRTDIATLVQDLRASITKMQPLSPDAGDLIARMPNADLKRAVEQSGVQHIVFRSGQRDDRAGREANRQASFGKNPRLSLYDTWDKWRKKMKPKVSPLSVLEWIRQGFYLATSTLPNESRFRIRHVFEVSPVRHVDLAAQIAEGCAVTFKSAAKGLVPLKEVEMRYMTCRAELDGFVTYELRLCPLQVEQVPVTGRLRVRTDARRVIGFSMPIGAPSYSGGDRPTPGSSTQIDSLSIGDEDLLQDGTDMKHAIENAVFGHVPRQDEIRFPLVYVAGRADQYEPNYELTAENMTAELLDMLEQVEYPVSPPTLIEKLKMAWQAFVQPSPNGQSVLFPVEFLQGQRFDVGRLFVEISEVWLGRRSWWPGQAEEMEDRCVIQTL